MPFLAFMATPYYSLEIVRLSWHEYSMNTRHRAGGGIISAAWLFSFGHQLLTLDPEKTIDFLVDLISPTSFYLGMVVIGIGGLSYFGWPAVQWVWSIPSRRKAKMQREQQAKEEVERKKAIHSLQKLKKISKDIVHHYKYGHVDDVDNNVERESEAGVLVKLLEGVGLMPTEFQTDDYGLLHKRVSRLLPHVEYRGIEVAKNEIEKILKEEKKSRKRSNP